MYGFVMKMTRLSFGHTVNTHYKVLSIISIFICFHDSLVKCCITSKLRKEKNKDDNEVIKQNYCIQIFLASVVSIVSPLGALVGGLMMDSWGRLNLLKIAAAPTIIGWLLIAVAKSSYVLIIGRALTGIPTVWGNAAFAYISEISCPETRGSFLAIVQVYMSLGTLLTYFEGSLMHWRWIAWSCIIFTVISFLLIMLLPESPSWLIHKGRLCSAEASLEWFRKTTDPQCIKNMDVFEEILSLLQKRRTSKHILDATGGKFERYKKWLKQPTVYKPLFILTGLFLFQQLSGTYITMIYAVSYIKDFGTTIDPYLASVAIGVTRLIMSILNIWLTRQFGRRSLLFFSALGMSLSMATSVIYIKWNTGTESNDWVPVYLLMAFQLFSMIGISTLPWTFVGELFPLEIRGVAQNLIHIITSFIEFGTIRSYFAMSDLMGGSLGMQAFFSVMNLLAFFYCYIFIPETHKKTLSEIEDYFMEHTTYLSVKQAERDPLLQKETTRLYGSSDS